MRRVLNGFCVTTIDLFAFYFAEFDNNNKFIGSFWIDTLTIASYNVTQNNVIEMKMMRHRTNERKEKTNQRHKIDIENIDARIYEYEVTAQISISQWLQNTLLCRHFFSFIFFFTIVQCTCIDCRYHFFYLLKYSYVAILNLKKNNP